MILFWLRKLVQGTRLPHILQNPDGCPELEVSVWELPTMSPKCPLPGQEYPDSPPGFPCEGTFIIPLPELKEERVEPSVPQCTPSHPVGKGQGSATHLPETQGPNSLGAAQLDN